ncbi:hypothetical protein OC846_003944 [Tilletia horrida]|uniref:Flavin-nucleotide-binding protein n=1 Tax=Tilletia horrida TaxID=155126 RepID=A0AAN6GNH4_9BASI|nr:hypothetical protein OC845_003957 [Tilletia horrida]KAK0549706.1 hypothetical protein OC846_003944 [Tilletia horrida]KAK0569941.1 hypothetical protein OC861_000391 [Tilletia horrida]
MEYEKTPANTINRKANKANYEVATVHSIVNEAPILHVSFVPDPYEPVPVILPMIGLMAKYGSDEDEHCYLHGYTASRFFKQTTKEGESGDPEGLQVCIAATIVDGLVLSLTPNSHSMNFRSSVLHGRATVVTDTAERLWAMEEITNSVVPGRWGQTRVPPNSTEMTSTKILKVKISSASSKIRAAEPSDEKYDVERSDVIDHVWTGVVPIHQSFGEPIPSSYNKVKDVPPNLTEYIAKANEDGSKYAQEVATKSPPK